MIWNIIEHRKRPYRWKRVSAIVEPAWHDNVCRDSDQAERNTEGAVYDERAGISLADAFAWANSRPESVTLYLYDAGGGIR